MRLLKIILSLIFCASVFGATKPVTYNPATGVIVSPANFASANGLAPSAYEVGIDLGTDYTEFEVKVMTPENECVYFYSTIRAAMTGGYGAAHPGVTDTGAKVVVLSVTDYGTEEDRLPYIYTYDTTGESYGSMLDFFDIGEGQSKAGEKFGVVKFRPDFTKAWVRAAFLNPQNYIIYWRQTIATGETITSGETIHKVWRLGILTPVFGN